MKHTIQTKQGGQFITTQVQERYPYRRFNIRVSETEKMQTQARAK